MKRIFAVAVLIVLCAGLKAQTIGVTSGTGAPKFAPKPLQCGKYQHEVPAHTENCSTNLMGCLRNVDAYCADDLHTVTEREWQELMARLKALEKPKEITDIACADRLDDGAYLEHTRKGETISYLILTSAQRDRLNSLPRCGLKSGGGL